MKIQGSSLNNYLNVVFIIKSELSGSQYTLKIFWTCKNKIYE